MKKRLTLLTAVLFIIGCLTLCACSEGISPVESIAVTSMPVIEYYRGDSFNLNNAAITVYYENGRVENVPIDNSMLSDFNSQSLGEQILTVKYGDVTAYIRVTVSQAPVYALEVAEGNYKKTYVQGQTLNVNDMYLIITYTNGFSETVPVTADMVLNFDTETSGEKQLVIEYLDRTATCDITVVARAISHIGIEVPEKTSYVVGDELDLTGGRIFVAYNNNTQTYIDAVDLLGDENFRCYISGLETDVFTSAGTVYVTVSYYGFTAEFFVRVAEIAATGLEIVTPPGNQPKNSPAPDLSAGRIRITYNNGEVVTLSMDDPRVIIHWKGFDITRNGDYEITVECASLSQDYTLKVVEPVEKELLIFVGDSIYYQDGADIDVTDWTYSILLTNGSYRAFDEAGATVSAVSENMLVGNPDFSAAEPGERSFTFRYESNDRTIILQTVVTVTVYEKVLTGIVNFTAPARTVYYRGDVLDLTGGGFEPVFNDGTVGGRVEITADMLDEDGSSYTAEISGAVNVGLTYADARYGGKARMSFVITVVKRAVSVSYSGSLSEGLKTRYILGESFDSGNLVVAVAYDDGRSATVTDFSGSEWSFAGTLFNAIGDAEVEIFYGDRDFGALRTVVPVTVTNDVTGIEFAPGFADFGKAIEGLDVSAEDAYLIATRENGDTERIKITRDMLDYDKFSPITGERSIKVSYAGYEIFSSVLVVGRSVSSVSVSSEPTKLAYTVSDTEWDLSGLVLRVDYDNGTTLRINGGELSFAEDKDGYAVYKVTAAGRSLTLRFDALITDFELSAAYARQNVNVAVTDDASESAAKNTSYEIVCFRRLITDILFFLDGESDSTVYVFENEELAFPDTAYLLVTYDGGETEATAIKDIAPEDIEVVGFDKKTAGIQSVTIKYLLGECSFTVLVRPKVLHGITVNPSAVTVVEGNAIPADALDIELHFVKADGSEYDVPYYSAVELSNTVCTFNPDAAFDFTETENGVGYALEKHTVSYTYGGVTVQATLDVRINRKTATKLTMKSYPKTVYLEGADRPDFEGGSVLVAYNNGGSETIPLTSDRLRISTTAFDTSEIENGGERQQAIRVYFTDSNNIEVSVDYFVTVKDRKYLSITYADDPVDNVYLFEYGTPAERRPDFVIRGYIDFDGEQVPLADGEKIDNLAKFQLKYINSSGVELTEWPAATGTYTLVITYDGDEVNNAFIDDSRRIRIYPKTVAVFAEKKDVIYGDVFDSGETVYTWLVKGYRVVNGSEIYSDDPLQYGDRPEDLAEISFTVHSSNGGTVTFFTAGGKTVIDANAGLYELKPVLSSLLSENYSIEKYVSATLEIKKKPIKIRASEVDKVYGEADPRFDNYEVYDSNDIKIGERGVIALDANYSDNISQYTLYRPSGEDSENAGRHAIGKGADSYISNYELVEYCSADLVIAPKPVTLTGTQSAARKYGQSVPAGGEYSFALKQGFSMAWDDTLDGAFGFLTDYAAGCASGKITVEIFLQSDLVGTVSPAADAVKGVYTVKIAVDDAAAPNYRVTVEDFLFEISPMDVVVRLGSSAIAYSDLTDEEDYAVGSTAYFDGGRYELTFGEGYSLSYTPELRLIKEKGLDAGRYMIMVAVESISANPDFAFTVTGDYGEFFEEFFADKPDIAAYMNAPADEDLHRAYLVILPCEFAFEHADSEIYSRKAVMIPELAFVFGGKDFDAEAQARIKEAFGFSFVNKTPSRAGYGYYTADGYDAQLRYDYFSNDTARNFIPEGVDAPNMATIYAYCFGGVNPDSADILTANFDYEVLPVELDIRVVNEDTGYTGEKIDVLLTEYAGNMCAGDALNIGYDISVKYYGRAAFAAAELVREAGDYRVSVTGIGNYNYALAPAAEGHVREFTVETVVLDIIIDIADADGLIRRTYSGRAMQPIDNSWHEVVNGDDVKGYFETTSHRIVNATSLTSTPRALRIEPVTQDGQGMEITPVNASATPYGLKWSVNEEYVNYSVRFVKANPAYPTAGDRYIEAEYGLKIEPKTVTLQNFQNARANFKTYDGKAPVMANLDKIIETGAISSDPVSVQNDLEFVFRRDMSKVPDEFKGIITEDDMTSAGYFTIEVIYKKSDNYVFELDGIEHYEINRVQVGVTLNNNNFMLSKQYDTLPPSASLADLRLSSPVTDEVYIEIISRHYGDGQSWNSYGGVNDAGLYAYDFKPYFMDGDRRVDSDFIDETSGNKLLSWNYSYYVSVYQGFDTNGCDGVFRIDPKDVSLTLTGAADGSFTIGSTTGEYYIYYRTYGDVEVTSEQAREEINAVYGVRDAAGVDLDASALSALGFDRRNIEVGGGSKIKTAGDYFAVDYSALAAANGNFNFVNKPILYVIGRLNVGLDVDFLNNKDGTATFTYGGSDTVTAIFDFTDKEAFMSALGIQSAEINGWLSPSQSDYGNDKFLLNNAVYYLTDEGGEAHRLSMSVTQDNVGCTVTLGGLSALNAGTYTVNVTGINAQNFSFTIRGGQFVIKPKEITVNGALRDYFDKDSLSLDCAPADAVERMFIGAVLPCFTDITGTADKAGSFEDMGYYIHARRADIAAIEEQFNNYRLVFAEVTPDIYDPANRAYLNLTVKKLPLSVTLKKPDGENLSVSYGQIILDKDYVLVFSGMPELNMSSEDYDSNVQLNLQNAVKDYVRKSIVDMEGVAALIGSLPAQALPYRYSLSDFVKNDTTLDNYELNLTDFYFTVNKIVLTLSLENNAGTAYHKDGKFSAVIDEVNSFTYSETGSGRLNYAFRINNPTAIIGYNANMTLEDMLRAVWVNGALPENYAGLVRYAVADANGSPIISAGVCKMKLTDNWYSSANYVLSCRESDIIVYPRAASMGEDGYNTLPLTAVSLAGVESDYVDSIIGRLSMLVRLSYSGMPEGRESEWVDIRRGHSVDLYDGANYSRNWSVAFVGTPPASIKEGDTVKLTLTYTESFYGGEIVNSFTSKEFLVRVYGKTDALTKDRTTSDFAYGETPSLSPFSELKDKNYTYYLTAGKGDTAHYEGKFDILGMDFALGIKNGARYSFEVVLFESTETKLTLGFRGGASAIGSPAGSYGYYVRLTCAEGEFISELTEYEVTSADGTTSMRSVLADVNIFDGRRHKLTAYIDKIGYVDTDEYTDTVEGSNVTRVMKRYFGVVFVLDDRYSYRLNYQGGTFTEIYNGDVISGSDYVDFVDFSGAGKTGFALSECTAAVSRFSLKTMGVGMSNDGYVQDVRLWPFENGAMIYLVQGTSLEDIIDTMTVNGNDGYDGKTRVVYSVTDIVADGPGDLSAAGLYRVVFTLEVNGITSDIRTVYVNVIAGGESAVELRDSRDGVFVAYPDSPVTLDGGNGRSAFVPTIQPSVDYTRIVFDFADGSDLEGNIFSSTVFLLKTSNNSKVDLSTPETTAYRGLAVKVVRTGTDETGEPVYRTLIQLRIDDTYWDMQVDGVSWVGKGNILEARYNYNNGVIDIRLTRGGAEKMSFKVRKNAFTGNNSTGGQNVAFGTENAKQIIGEPGGNGGYAGIQLFRSEVTLYEFRVTEPKPADYVPVYADGSMADEEAVSGDADVLLSDSRGRPIATTTGNTYLRFAASGGDFRLMFANNTPYFFGVKASRTVTGDRGMVLYFSTDGVYLSMYKYDVEWRRQKLVATNFLDGEEHTVIVRISDEEVPAVNNIYGVDGYGIDVVINGITYHGVAPKYNALLSVMTQNGTSGSDDEEELYYGTLKDEFFLPDSRYVGLMPMSATIQIKEMFVF